MKPSLISCIVPVFNGERYLGEALDSILAQTYRPIEVIIVDDGSTDGTAAVAAGYGDKVRYFWQKNAGEAAARNRGLIAAQGDFFAFLDADDLWHPEKLTRQIARFRQRSEIDLCFTYFRNFWVPELAKEEQFYRRSLLSQQQSGWSTSTLLACRSAFERFGNFVEDGSLTRGTESMIWFLRCEQRGAVIAVLQETLMERLHATNLSRKNTVEVLLPILKVWRDHQWRAKS
jgi:glycosyltransferase involved in cell wall biosynthesis